MTTTEHRSPAGNPKYSAAVGDMNTAPPMNACNREREAGVLPASIAATGPVPPPRRVSGSCHGAAATRPTSSMPLR